MTCGEKVWHSRVMIPDSRFQIPKSKARVVGICSDFEEPIGGAAVEVLMPLKYSVRELAALQFFGGIGSSNGVEELQDS